MDLLEVDPCNAQGATPLHLASEAAKKLGLRRGANQLL